MGGYILNPFTGLPDMVSGNLSRISASTTTANATPATIASIPLDEGVVVFIEAIVTGTKSDQSSVGCAVISGLFYRATGGDVTQQGGTEDRSVQLSGTWDVTYSADTVNQEVDIVVTGAAATAITWKADVSYMVIG